VSSDYRVNRAAVEKARELIGAGEVDAGTPWSEAAPSTERANEVLDRDGWQEYGAWHLAVDPDASEETKGRYAFPYGDFRKVNRAALIHAKQRAAQNDHAEVEQAADDLLRRVDEAGG
jgi:hypothetical protein